MAVNRGCAAVLPLFDRSVRRDSGVMTTEQTQTLLAMAVVLGMFVLLVLPSVIGIVHDRRIDRQIREAQERDAVRTQ